MKRYLIPLLIIFVLAPVLVSCSQGTDPFSNLPDKPVYTEQEVIILLQEFLEGDRWATPIFPIEKWSASYAGDRVWLVEAYNIDESYMGTWSVKERSSHDIMEGLSNEIKPYDEAAESPKNLMPPLPQSLSSQGASGYFPPNRKTLIMAVQQHIANMSYKEAETEGTQNTWEAIRTHYPIDWRIEYTDTIWILTGIECRAYVFAYTGQIDAFYAFTDPSW